MASDHSLADSPIDPGSRKSDPADRRTAPRVHMEVEVTLGSETQFFAGLSGDISSGGIFVSTYQRVKVGTEVSVQFTLPNGSVNAKGTVRWLRDANPKEGLTPGLGICFESLAPVERSMVQSFCAARAPLYMDVDEPTSQRG
jgi:uncharacterized protein (TIGR02266 family)